MGQQITFSANDGCNGTIIQGQTSIPVGTFSETETDNAYDMNILFMYECVGTVNYSLMMNVGLRLLPNQHGQSEYLSGKQRAR